MIRITEARKTSKSSLEDVISNMPENLITNIMDRLPLQDAVRTSILSTSWRTMDRVYGTHNASAAEEDVITRMPENVITHILDRLPIKDAVRTAILSRNWRFNWNMLTQLVFDANFFRLGLKGKRGQDERNISSILLQLKSCITKFELVIPDYKTPNVEEVSLWVMLLSRKGVKEFTLLNYHETPIKLPSHFFSCLDLERLVLRNCCFHPPPNFHGFPNLVNLHLISVRFESYKCLKLITCCPLLETLSIAHCIPSSKVKLTEVAKLINRVFFYISISALEITPVTTYGIFQFLRDFPKLEVLYLDLEKCKFLAELGDRKGVPTSFPCLEILQLWSVDFGNDVMVSYVFEMICCSPNLQTLTIVASSSNHVPMTVLTSLAVDCNTTSKLQLRNVVFQRFRGLENEVCLIKSLLASSPLLHNMRIELNSSSMVDGDDGKFMFASKLLKFYRVSPEAEIDLL